MSDQELYAKLINAALENGEISHALASRVPARIEKAIGEALGPENATPERVDAIARVTDEEWATIRQTASFFGRDNSIN